MSHIPLAQSAANSALEKPAHQTVTTHSLPSHPLQQSYPSSSASQSPQNSSQIKEHPPQPTGVESSSGAKMKSPQSPRSGGNSPTPPPGRATNQQQQQQHGISYVHGTTASPRKKSCESPRGGVGGGSFSPRTPRTNRAAQVRLQR